MKRRVLRTRIADRVLNSPIADRVAYTPIADVVLFTPDDDDVDTAALLQCSMAELVALSGDSDDTRAAFVSRVYRSAVPLHVLMLLLLGLACLLPSGDEEFSCFLANNFERSLAVMIKYNDGSPPV